MFQDHINSHRVPEDAMELQDVLVPQVALNLHFMGHMPLHPKPLHSSFPHDLQGCNIASMPFFHEPNVPEATRPDSGSQLEVVQTPHPGFPKHGSLEALALEAEETSELALSSAARRGLNGEADQGNGEGSSSTGDLARANDGDLRSTGEGDLICTGERDLASTDEGDLGGNRQGDL
eukprot:CAMPEP_0170601602 /NCGR_PEP_ID=MMETSP0224-20130122/17949_1 /TAXON_ID=285029 /ORGANISM="Togula jolla, Strain CCCM 725" /LENGTH=176 /DNA_ID=CAMNT_0010926393 /DNA_START=599 /DNA_END=1126 /DNA_ORIENTATION=-